MQITQPTGNNNASASESEIAAWIGQQQQTTKRKTREI